MKTSKILVFAFSALLSLIFVDAGAAQENGGQKKDWTSSFPEIPNCSRQVETLQKYKSLYSQNATYTEIKKTGVLKWLNEKIRFCQSHC